MINFLFLSGTKAIYVCDFVRKTLFLENPTNLLLSYRFRFIGCEALCIRVRDSRNTDSQSTNEDVCILTSLNFISLSLFCIFMIYFFFFFRYTLFCTISDFFAHLCTSLLRFFAQKCTREREREYNLIRSKNGMIEFFKKIWTEWFYSRSNCG